MCRKTWPSAPICSARTARGSSLRRSRRFAASPSSIRWPFSSAATQFAVPLDAKTGAEVKLAGKVERRGGFKGDVTVSLAGVPAGIAVPTVVVKADKTDFQLSLKFPVGFKTLDVNTIEVFATGKFVPSSPLLNRSEAVAVRVKLTPAPVAVKK